MMVAALIAAVLIGIAIYSLSQVEQQLEVRYFPTPKLTFGEAKPVPAAALAQLPKDWVLVSFWSITCAPCLNEMPSLNQFARVAQQGRFRVVTVNTDSGVDLDSAKRFLLENDIEIQVYFDSKKELANAFEVESIPRHFLINPDRQIVWDSVGAFRWDDSSVQDQVVKLMSLPDAEPPSEFEE